VGRQNTRNICFHIGSERSVSDAYGIVEGTDPSLLVAQQDKSHVYPLGGDANARLIAAALAACENDTLYRAEYGLSQRSGIEVVGIVMNGSWPPKNVRNNTSPYNHCTTVFAYRPTVPRPQQRLEGMKPLDNRRLLVTKFLRLKQLMLRMSGKRQ